MLIIGLQHMIASPFTFVLESTVNSRGKWLTIATKSSIPSNLAPAITPTNVSVISYTFSNEKANAYADFEFFVNGNLAYTWRVSDRTGYKNGAISNPLFTMQAGEQLSVRGKEVSGEIAAKEAILTVYFALTEHNSNTEQFFELA